MCHLLPYLEKNQVYFNETQFLYAFEKFYYFICILRQICDNLVMKNFKFTTVKFYEILQLASKHEKTHAAREKFSFHNTVMTENNNNKTPCQLRIFHTDFSF